MRLVATAQTAPVTAATPGSLRVHVLVVGDGPLLVREGSGTRYGVGTAVRHWALVVRHRLAGRGDGLHLHDRPLLVRDRSLLAHGHLRAFWSV